MEQAPAWVLSHVYYLHAMFFYSIELSFHKTAWLTFRQLAKYKGWCGKGLDEVLKATS